MLGTLWYFLFSFHLLCMTENDIRHMTEWHTTAMQATCIRHQCGLVNISWHLSALFLTSFCQFDRSDSRRISSPGLGFSWLKCKAGKGIPYLRFRKQKQLVIFPDQCGTCLSLTYVCHNFCFEGLLFLTVFFFFETSDFECNISSREKI